MPIGNRLSRHNGSVYIVRDKHDRVVRATPHKSEAISYSRKPGNTYEEVKDSLTDEAIDLLSRQEM